MYVPTAIAAMPKNKRCLQSSTGTCCACVTNFSSCGGTPVTPPSVALFSISIFVSLISDISEP